MKHINEYIQDSLDLHQFGMQVMESEQNLLQEHSVQLTSIFNKLGKYNSDICHQRFDESDSSYTFTLDEQQVIQEMFEIICNKYIYQTQVNEGLKDSIKKIYNTSKDAIEQGIEAAHIKIKQINDFLNELKDHAITKVKELVEKFLNLLSTLKCSVQKLFDVMGFKDEEAHAEYTKQIEEALKDPAVTKENVYEGVGEKLWTNMKPVLIQVAASTITTYIVPTIIVAIGGLAAAPLAALVKHISEIAWSSVAIVTLIKGEVQYHKKGIYKSLPTWGKVIHCIFFIAVLAWGVATASDAIKGFGEILSKALDANEALKDIGADVFGELFDMIMKKLKGKTVSNMEPLEDLIIDAGGVTLTKIGEKTIKKLARSEETEEAIIATIGKIFAKAE